MNTMNMEWRAVASVYRLKDYLLRCNLQNGAQRVSKAGGLVVVYFVRFIMLQVNSIAHRLTRTGSLVVFLCFCLAEKESLNSVST